LGTRPICDLSPARLAAGTITKHQDKQPKNIFLWHAVVSCQINWAYGGKLVNAEFKRPLSSDINVFARGTRDTVEYSGMNTGEFRDKPLGMAAAASQAALLYSGR
jgi:hypothetical protein